MGNTALKTNDRLIVDNNNKSKSTSTETTSDRFYENHTVNTLCIRIDRKNIVSPFSQWIVMEAITNNLKLTKSTRLIRNTPKQKITESTASTSIPYNNIKFPSLKYRLKENKEFAQNKINTPLTTKKPNDKVFIVGEYYNHAINKLSKDTQLIPERIRLILIHELDKLSKDNRIKYDIRNANTCEYTTSQKPDIFGGYGYNKYDDAVLIHDLIDPFKYVYNHPLWIPSIFNVDKVTQKCVIQTEILNLDRVKYYKLYDLMAAIFYEIHPLIENILHRSIGREKVIIKSMTYILSKPGDIYQGQIHREGMGENIECVAIYYPQMDKEIVGGQLELIVIDPRYNHKQIKIDIDEGDLIIFSNECFHRLVGIQYPGKYNYNQDIDDEKEYKVLIRSILAFFIIKPKHSMVTMENVNKLHFSYSDLDINLSFNCRNIIRYWSKLYWMGVDDKRYFDDEIFELEFLYHLVEIYVCGNEMYVYNERATFRRNRFISMKLPTTKPGNDWNIEDVFLKEAVVDEGLAAPPLLNDPFDDDFYFDHTQNTNMYK